MVVDGVVSPPTRSAGVGVGAVVVKRDVEVNRDVLP